MNNIALRPLLSMLLSAFFVSILPIGCSPSAQLLQQWKDPYYKKGPMASVLVIAMKANPTVRRLWEDGFVSALNARGVSAIPSYRDFPDKLPDTTEALNAVHENKYDGVLVAKRIGADTVHRTVRGYYAFEPVQIYDPWRNMYYPYFTEMYHPGYTETQRNIRHEISMFSTSGFGQLIWSGTALVTDPTSTEDVNKQIVTAVVPELARQGVIRDEKRR